MPKAVQNVNIFKIVPLVPPRELCGRMPLPPRTAAHILKSRETVRRILHGQDRRLLAIVGPCSIHDPRAALDYARRLNALRRKFAGRLFIIMRVYFEKPRTTIGWKGLIADPRLDGSADLSRGLEIARGLLLKISGMGLPAATEVLDPIVPQYIADLVTWAAIGARTTESQTHREMASGLSMPVGFKNGTEGNLQAALDAMESSRHPHSFLGINGLGQTAVVRTRGNPFVHLILRGGKSGPNYDVKNVRAAAARLHDAGLPPAIVVDCSHANSGKRHEAQARVLKSVLAQRKSGRCAPAGFMLESNLESGCQPIPVDLTELRYGVSVTDSCLGWDKTAELLALAFRETRLK